jgi:hypothetical protein
MQNATIVRRGKSGHQLACNVESLFVGEIPDALDQRLQVLAIDVLHREEVTPLEFGNIVGPADIRMRQLSRDPHFGEKTFAAHRI